MTITSVYASSYAFFFISRTFVTVRSTIQSNIVGNKKKEQESKRIKKRRPTRNSTSGNPIHCESANIDKDERTKERETSNGLIRHAQHLVRKDHTGDPHPKLVAAPPAWNVAWIAFPLPYIPKHAIAKLAAKSTRLKHL